jgi:hypothetical protein
MKFVSFEVPIYRVVVDFCITKQPLELVNQLEADGYRLEPKDRADLLSENTSGLACQVLLRDEVASILMWLPKYTGQPEDMNVLAHEICHVKNYIFHYVGQDCDVNNDEAETHLVGELMEAFALWRKNKYQYL